jgi:hypothetical protein
MKEVQIIVKSWQKARPVATFFVRHFCRFAFPAGFGDATVFRADCGCFGGGRTGECGDPFRLARASDVVLIFESPIIT